MNATQFLFNTSFKFTDSDNNVGGGHDKEVVFSEKVSFLTLGDYPALGTGPVEDLAFAPDQEGILLTVHSSGKVIYEAKPTYITSRTSDTEGQLGLVISVNNYLLYIRS